MSHIHIKLSLKYCWKKSTNTTSIRWIVLENIIYISLLFWKLIYRLLDIYALEILKHTCLLKMFIFRGKNVDAVLSRVERICIPNLIKSAQWVSWEYVLRHIIVKSTFYSWKRVRAWKNLGLSVFLIS